MTDFILKLMHSKGGALVQWGVGALMGYLVALAARYSINIPQDVLESVEKALTLGGAFLATAAVQWYQNVQNKKVQRGLDTEDDGWIGPETIKAAHEN